MNFRKYINNSTALQSIGLLKYVTFFIFSIILVKSGYSKTQIGKFETTNIIANAISFFWVYGIIHSLMTLYNSNNSFSAIDKNRKSPEIFNAFILLFGFNLLLLSVFIIIINHLDFFGSEGEKFSFITIIVLSIFFSNPACLVEHIYILRNKPRNNLIYGLITYLLMLISVSVPLILKLDIKIALGCLVGNSIFRFIWLLTLLKKYAEFRFSLVFMKELIKLANPLILSYLLSGSAEYIDNIIISLKFNFFKLAEFRYGAKELPFSSGLVTGLHSSMIPCFSSPKETQSSVALIKKKSKRLMHILFPISILFLFMANILYPLIFRPDFSRSSDVFMVYLLLIMTRLLFPQTILIGLKQNRTVLHASLVAIILNIILSLFLMPYYGIVGVALATVLVYSIEKVVLMWLVYKHHRIKPAEYTPIFTYLIYSVILVLVFVLIDHRIINV